MARGPDRPRWHSFVRRTGTGALVALLCVYAVSPHVGFIAKDVKIAVDTAKSIGAYAPLGERVSELWPAAVEQLGYDLDPTQVARYWEEATGVRL